MRFTCEQWLPAPRDAVFAFFSNAANLEAITPAWLHFKTLTPEPLSIARGTIIDYRLRLHGIPFHWRSEIAVWDPPRQFVDEQQRGPYKRWIHTHTFIAERGGTTVRDTVDYDIPFAWLARRFVERDIRRIFEYRKRVLLNRFST